MSFNQPSAPVTSDVKAAVASATIPVTTTATSATGGVATIALGDALAALATYLTLPDESTTAPAANQTTVQYRTNVDFASQKFNEFVAAINRVVA